MASCTQNTAFSRLRRVWHNQNGHPYRARRDRFLRSTDTLSIGDDDPQLIACRQDDDWQHDRETPPAGDEI